MRTNRKTALAACLCVALATSGCTSSTADDIDSQQSALSAAQVERDPNTGRFFFTRADGQKIEMRGLGFGDWNAFWAVRADGRYAIAITGRNNYYSAPSHGRTAHVYDLEKLSTNPNSGALGCAERILPWPNLLSPAMATVVAGLHLQEVPRYDWHADWAVFETNGLVTLIEQRLGWSGDTVGYNYWYLDPESNRVFKKTR